MLTTSYTSNIDLFRYPGVEYVEITPDIEEDEDYFTHPVLDATNLPSREEQKQDNDFDLHFNLPESAVQLEADHTNDGENPIRDRYLDYLLSWEKKTFTTVKGDRGGPTNSGITLSTWKDYGYDKNGDGKIDVKDLKLIDENDWKNLITNQFWNYCRADEIKNPYLASFLVDWTVMSGRGGIKHARKALGLSSSSVVDDEMIKLLNSSPTECFEKLKKAREAHYRGIARRDPSLMKFLKGWLRRVNSITLNSLTNSK